MKKRVPEKFLLIQFRQIGDVILTTPIPAILRHHFPHSQIDFLTFAVNEPTWRHNPHISNLLTFNRKDGFGAFVKLLKQIRSGHYDAVLDFQNTPRSTYCSIASLARYRVTWSNSSRRMVYNTLVPSSDNYPSAAKSNFLKPFIKDAYEPAKMPPPRPEVHFTDTESKKIDAIFSQYGLKPDDFIVTMAPTHRRIVRRWPLEFFLETAKYLIETYHAKVILSWGPGEEEYIQKGIEEGNYANANLISDLFLNLLELAALMKRCKFHFGNDSAPQHLAVSQNLPTFSIFGATSTSWAYPALQNFCVQKNMDCQPCNKLECRFGQAIPCLKELKPKEIQPTLDRFIQTVTMT